MLPQRSVKGFGEADDSGTKVTPETPFVLGSSTKSVTALATMQLVGSSPEVSVNSSKRQFAHRFMRTTSSSTRSPERCSLSSSMFK
jgi:hypothetical protein